MRNTWSALLAAALSAGFVVSGQAQTRVLTGRVVDSLTAKPITAGEISVLGTGLAAPIREDGTFAVSVPMRELTLSVSISGYKAREQRVRSTDEDIQVRLERDFFNQENQVVSGQATSVERKNLANAVTQVGGDELEKSSARRMDQALKGRVPGADVSEGPQPGAQITMRLRGISSLLANNPPLFIVDGVTVYNIDAINPNDIESIEVLKGASASAMYGSKASNGVVIIKTKRGGTVGRR